MMEFIEVTKYIYYNKLIITFECKCKWNNK